MANIEPIGLAPPTVMPAARVLLQAGLFTVALLSFLNVGASHPRPQTELEQIFYDMGVIGYCGLYSDAVSAGFRQQLAGLVERDKVNATQLQDARNRALTMVEQEWDNRGLGGFRRWCRTEGEAAVRRFSD